MKSSTKGILFVAVLVGIAVAATVLQREFDRREIDRRAESQAQSDQEAKAKAHAQEQQKLAEVARLEKARVDFAPIRGQVLAKADALLQSDPSKVAGLLAEFRGLNDPDVESFARAAEIRAAGWSAAQRHEISESELRARRKDGIVLGMSAERVLQSSWGRPERVHKSTSVGGGEREYWIYRSGSSLFFADGVLITINTVSR